MRALIDKNHICQFQMNKLLKMQSNIKCLLSREKSRLWLLTPWCNHLSTREVKKRNPNSTPNKTKWKLKALPRQHQSHHLWQKDKRQQEKQLRSKIWREEVVREKEMTSTSTKVTKRSPTSKQSSRLPSKMVWRSKIDKD
jgi:hypothetical protein